MKRSTDKSQFLCGEFNHFEATAADLVRTRAELERARSDAASVVEEVAAATVMAVVESARQEAAEDEAAALSRELARARAEASMLRVQAAKAGAVVAAVVDARQRTLAEAWEVMQAARTAAERARAEADSFCSKAARSEEEQRVTEAKLGQLRTTGAQV